MSEQDLPTERSIHDLIAVWAERTPEATALVFSGRAVSYGELDRRANQVAHALRGLGVGLESIVGLSVTRSPELVIGVLGILKAGGAWLPLDPRYPRRRLAELIEDARVGALLGDQRSLEALPLPGRAVPSLCLDRDRVAIDRQQERSPDSGAGPDNAAYVIYTSGSTGRPKGVVLEQRGLLNMAEAQVRAFAVDPASRVLQFASLNFDASVFELVLALRSGATLVLATAEDLAPGPPLWRLLRAERITHTLLPPSVMATLPEGELPALRVLISGGEALTAELAARFAPGRRLFNAYGPTEVTVYATLLELGGAPGVPSLGRPILNTRVHLLDERGAEVQPGDPGELHVAGPGLARGYLHRPDLTAEAFLPDPFGPPGSRLYRTGDRARLRSDGSFEFLGRTDRQEKVRGFRVEPGEIEVVLGAHPSLREVVVVGREEAGGGRRLIAYVVAQPGREAALLDLRTWLAERLPEYMIPSLFVPLVALPRLPNDKIDRAALPAPGPGRPELSAPFVAPRTETERALAAIFGEVLRVAPIGVDDDFFAFGGDSLRAIRVLARITTSLRVSLPLRALFDTPTVERLARQIGRGVLANLPEGPPLVPRTGDSDCPLSFAQQRLWFLHQLDKESAAYHVPASVRFDGPLDADRLAKALTGLVRRHEALRTVFPRVDGAPVQRVIAPREVALPMVDLARLTDDERRARITDETRDAFGRPFDLANAPPLRARLLRLGEGEHILLLALHHIVCDGRSMVVLLEELSALYDGCSAPALAVQFPDFAVWERRLASEKADAHLAFWRDELRGAPTVIRLPADRPPSVPPSARGARQSVRVPQPLAEALLRLAHGEGATLFMTLLAAFDLLLAESAGVDLLVATPIENRRVSALEGLIGCFADTVVIRARLEGDPTFRALLGRVRERTLAAWTHQDLPFERIVEALRPARDGGDQPLVQVLFALQEPPLDRATGDGVRWHFVEVDDGAAPFDLMLELWESPAGLEGSFLYRRDRFDAFTIETLAGRFTALLAAIAAGPDRPLSELAHIAESGEPDGEAGSEASSEASIDLGHALPEAELALLDDPEVEECAVRMRRGVVGELVVAYVVTTGAAWAPSVTLPPELRKAVWVPLTSLPLGADGLIDEVALSRMEVIDEQTARGVEQALAWWPAVDAVAVIDEHVESPERLHLADLLPDAPRSLEAPPAARGRPPEAASTATRPPALSDGGPLNIPAGEPRTLGAALLRAAAGRRGITFVAGDGAESRVSYSDLLVRARSLLAGLTAQGLAPGDRVILQIDSLADHFAAFWACLLGGIVPTSVAIAPSYEEAGAVVKKLHHTWQLLGGPMILALRHLVPSLQGLGAHLSMAGARVLAVEDLRGDPALARLHDGRPDDVAFLQLTSGSTGLPKCIQETHDGIIHHIHGARIANGYSDTDVDLNWLPVDHVVPILTCHLKDVYLGCEQIQVATEHVLARPLAWLDLLAAHRATHTWSPNFGFKRIADALPVAGRSWDLSSVRAFMNAGEQVTLPVVRDFLRLLAPHGVRPEAIQPSFGMAEACTCMTFHNRFDLVQGVHRIRKRSLGGGALEVADSTDVSDDSIISFVDLGPPVPGVRVRIVDAENGVLPEGTVGRMQIHGAVVTPGYLFNEPANREAFVGDGWFNSGDLGFLLGGRLTLTGREKEIIIVRGANYYCYEVEDIVQSVAGVEPTFAAACAVDDPQGGTEGMAVFFVPRDPVSPTPVDDATASLVAAVRAQVTSRLGLSPLHVVPVARCDFPRTTSGKIQRGDLKRALAAGHFDSAIKALDLHAGNARTLPDWFHRRVWRRKEAAVALRPREPGEGVCLLIAGPSSLAADLAVRLRSDGRRVVRVESGPGREIECLAADHLRIDLADGASWARLLDPIACGVAEVVHLGSFGEGGVPDAELGLLALTTALLTKGQRPVRLLVVSSGAQPVAPDEPIDLAQAALLGLLQTLPLEAPRIDARHLDLQLAPADVNAQLILRELRARACDREVAYRGGRRLCARLQRADLRAASSREDPFVQGGRYLLAGGLGGVGSELARHLLVTRQARLLVIGRSPPDRRSDEIAALEQVAERAGGEILCRQTDLADGDRLRSIAAAAEAHFGAPLDGAVHLAGLLGERLLRDETPETFAATLHPKVAGARALVDLLADRPGSLLVCFSSVNATFGGFSVGAYSAASRFLAHLAHERRRGGQPTHCIEWSLWDEIGMTRGHPMKEAARARGYQAISASRGMASLEVALRRGDGHLLIGLDGSGRPVRRRLDGAVAMRRLSIHFSGTEHPSVKPQDRLGRDVSLRWVPLVRLPRTPDGAIDPAALPGQRQARGSSVGDRPSPRGETERTLAAIWQDVLRVDEVGRDDNFFDLGGHSMLLVQVRDRVSRTFDRDVPIVDLFRHPTLRALAAHLASKPQPSSSHIQVDQRARKQRAAQERQRQRPGARPKNDG
ncbi:MAG: amino acid adenylation domain-containing protein [Myxococcales bacterium]|nr:amino acid adenylation domain-containing protein [Myxococcales bacterium]